MATASGNADEAATFAQMWSTARTDHLSTLAEQLRAAGFPLHIIRAVLRNQIEEQFAGRIRELTAAHPDQPFWRTGGMSFDPKLNAAMRALGREMNDEFKRALGPDARVDEDETRAYQNRVYGNLARDKIERLQEIRGDYSELQQQIYSSTNGMFLPEDREKLALLEKEQRADIAKILTPEELFDYELRSSGTASMLRSRLAAFRPTEEEFRAIFKLQQSLDLELGGLNVYSAADYQQRQARQAELNKQVEAVLSPPRAAEYKIATDPPTQQLSRVAARFGLPLQAVADVAAVQREINERAMTVRSNPSLSADTRTQQLAALATEASARVERTLGGRAFSAYKENGGQWLTTLARPSRPPTPQPKS